MELALGAKLAALAIFLLLAALIAAGQASLFHLNRARLRNLGEQVLHQLGRDMTLSVTYPAAGNIGGGGFMVIHPPPGKGEPVVIVYRETAPLAASTANVAICRFRLGCVIITTPLLAFRPWISGDCSHELRSARSGWPSLSFPRRPLAPRSCCSTPSGPGTAFHPRRPVHPHTGSR